MRYLKTALFYGTGAAAFSLGAILFLSRFEDRAAVRPINATSHVLWGPEDATSNGIDMRLTLPGLLINISAAYFWGGVCALGTWHRARLDGSAIIGSAVMTSLIAAIVDYGIVPRRLRPGWEHALKPRSVATALAAMGAGLVAGGFAVLKADKSASEGAE